MTSRDLQVLNIPVSNDGERMRNVVMYVPTPLTFEEWAHLLTILDAMRPGLVEPDRTIGASE